MIEYDDELDVEFLSLFLDDDDDDDELQGCCVIVLSNKLLKFQGVVVDEDDDLWNENDEDFLIWSGVD